MCLDQIVEVKSCTWLPLEHAIASYKKQQWWQCVQPISLSICCASGSLTEHKLLFLEPNQMVPQCTT